MRATATSSSRGWRATGDAAVRRGVHLRGKAGTPPAARAQHAVSGRRFRSYCARASTRSSPRSTEPARSRSVSSSCSARSRCTSRSSGNSTPNLQLPTPKLRHHVEASCLGSWALGIGCFCLLTGSFNPAQADHTEFRKRGLGVGVGRAAWKIRDRCLRRIERPRLGSDVR